MVVNGNPAIAYQNGNSIKYVRANDASGNIWDTPLAFNNTGLVGQYNSMKMINGVPAISYYNTTFNGSLLYAHATDASGASWATPGFTGGGPTGTGNTGKYSCLLEVNSSPAVAYYDNFTSPAKLNYRRATNAEGTAWATAISIAVTGNLTTRISMQIVNNNPAIVYYDALAGDLKFIRATDINGSAWASAITVDGATANVGQNANMQIINGNPAISYYNSTTGELKYVRANDPSGTTWGTPVTVESSFFGVAWEAYYPMEIVNGNPAVSFYTSNGYLKFARATDLNGTSWATSINVDLSGNVGQWMSMQVVNGNPAISYYDVTNHDLRYVRASDANGLAWAATVALDTMGDAGQYNSMIVVNGNPAISYYDATNRLLRFISSTDFDLPTKVSLCSFGNTSLTSSITGTTYQWQVNTGSGFVNTNDDANYSNTNTANLQLNNIPSSWYGYQYRCVVDGNNSYAYSLRFLNNWNGSVSTSWENPANWDCGILPDSNTEVIINSGTVVLSSDASCRSLAVKPGATFTISSGFNLTVVH